MHAIGVGKRETQPLFGWECKGSKKQKQKQKQKLLLSGNEVWHGQYGVMVVAGQPTDQWEI